MTGDPVPFWGRTNSAGVLRCDCALCADPSDLHWQLLPQYERELAAERADVPNRLYGATINHKGEAV